VGPHSRRSESPCRFSLGSEIRPTQASHGLNAINWILKKIRSIFVRRITDIPLVHNWEELHNLWSWLNRFAGKESHAPS
jgi:transposase